MLLHMSCVFYLDVSKQKCHVFSKNYYFFCSKYIARLLGKMKIESKKIINEDREQTENTKDMQSQYCTVCTLSAFSDSHCACSLLTDTES
jgi:hypothetical protein